MDLKITFDLQTVGKIDHDYRGEVMVKLTCDVSSEALTVMPGDRIAQAEIVPVHRISEFVFSEELSETERGEGGFGSTGK